MLRVSLYADGSGTKSPGNNVGYDCGGAFTIVVDGEARYSESTYYNDFTVPRAELDSVVRGIKWAHEHDMEVVHIVSDATSVTDTIPKVRSMVWETTSGKPLQNLDLWKEYAEAEAQQTTLPAVEHVDGHTGHPFNELCDKLACEARRNRCGQKLYLDRPWCLEHAPGCGADTWIDPLPTKARIETETPLTERGVLDNKTFFQYIRSVTDDRRKCCALVYEDLTAYVSLNAVAWVKRGSGKKGDPLCVALAEDDGTFFPFLTYGIGGGSPMTRNCMLDMTDSKVDYQQPFGEVLANAARKAVQKNERLFILTRKQEAWPVTYMFVGTMDATGRCTCTDILATTRIFGQRYCLLSTEQTAMLMEVGKITDVGFVKKVDDATILNRQAPVTVEQRAMHLTVRNAHRGAFFTSLIPTHGFSIAGQFFLVKNGKMTCVESTKEEIKVGPYSGGNPMVPTNKRSIKARDSQLVDTPVVVDVPPQEEELVFVTESFDPPMIEIPEPPKEGDPVIAAIDEPATAPVEKTPEVSSPETFSMVNAPEKAVEVPGALTNHITVDDLVETLTVPKTSSVTEVVAVIQEVQRSIAVLSSFSEQLLAQLDDTARVAEDNIKRQILAKIKDIL